MKKDINRFDMKGQRLMWFRAFLLAVATALVSLLIYLRATAENTKTIQIVVPDHYVGPVEIHEDKQNGVDAVMKGGTLTIEIDDTGKIVLKNRRHFFGWHRQYFKTRSGVPLMAHGPITPAQSSDDIKYAFDLGTASTNGGPDKLLFFIGTTTDASKFLDEMAK